MFKETGCCSCRQSSLRKQLQAPPDAEWAAWLLLKTDKTQQSITPHLLHGQGTGHPHEPYQSLPATMNKSSCSLSLFKGAFHFSSCCLENSRSKLQADEGFKQEAFPPLLLISDFYPERACVLYKTPEQRQLSNPQAGVHSGKIRLQSCLCSFTPHPFNVN